MIPAATLRPPGAVVIRELAIAGARGGLFAACIFGLLFVTGRVTVPGVARYDLLLVACILLQVGFVLTRFETKGELLAITCFHLVGLGMELFKVNVAGSWSYPGAEAAWFTVGGVPFFAGFMYASVASFLCQLWRRLEIGTRCWPSSPAALAAAGLIYGNFFANAWLPDQRVPILALVILLFLRTTIILRPVGRRFELPLLPVIVALGLLIYAAENLATFLGAWRYPSQLPEWQPVDSRKITSWMMLIVLSLLLVRLVPRAVADRPDAG
jgi:uncharacterized membrane protein YoaT (DUF817 family)